MILCNEHQRWAEHLFKAALMLYFGKPIAWNLANKSYSFHFVIRCYNSTKKTFVFVTRMKSRKLFRNENYVLTFVHAIQKCSFKKNIYSFKTDPYEHTKRSKPTPLLFIYSQAYFLLNQHTSLQLPVTTFSLSNHHELSCTTPSRIQYKKTTISSTYESNKKHDTPEMI